MRVRNCDLKLFISTSRTGIKTTHRGGGLRKFLSLFFASAVVLCASRARAQHIDFALGAGTIWSPYNITAETGFIPPSEKGGVYPQASLQYILPSNLGFNVEGSFRYHKTFYNDYQPYRPIFYDVNAVFAPRLSRRFSADFMGGIGGETVLFYSQLNQCTAIANECRSFVNSTHFMTHMGADVRYYFKGNLFVRPEAHWNFIPNNFQFYSRHILRMGASIGYSFGSR